MKRIFTFIIIFMLTLLLIPYKTVDALFIPEEYEETSNELRGAWVATVSQIDMPRQKAATEAAIREYKDEYIKVLDNLLDYNMNAIFFQIRPMNDAFYKSKINPWSRYLIGVEGRDPGWDPLEWMIEETHKRGIEFHAWLNPYRASHQVPIENDGINKYLNGLGDNNFAKNNRDMIVLAGDIKSSTRQILLNPAEPTVRQHIYDTISEIVENYDVNAIHFDDYFYNDVDHSADDATYRKPGYNPKKLNKEDWRRDQVDMLVEGIHDLIKDFNEKNNRRVQFGISPAAMWAPAQGPQAVEGGHVGTPDWGYYCYHDLYADTRKWVREEWLDYILPQNYFNLGRYHETISEWWAEEVKNTSVKLYMGIGAHNIGSEGYGDKQLAMQMRFNKQFPEIDGLVFFSYKNLVRPHNDTMREGVKIIKEYWANPAFLPFKGRPNIDGVQEPDINLTRTNEVIKLSFSTIDNVLGYDIYRFTDPDKIEYNEENLVARVNNVSDTITYTDEVDNDTKYIYFIRSYLQDYSYLPQPAVIESDAYINENAPEILYFEIDKVRGLYEYKERIRIRGAFKDIDGDKLTVTLEMSLKDDRFRYNLSPDIIDGAFDYEHEFYSLEGEAAVFRLTVFDGEHEVVAYSHRFIVTNKPYNQLLILGVQEKRNNKINLIIK